MTCWKSEEGSICPTLRCASLVAPDEAAECNVVFSAFQLKLIELRREMERKVNMLAEKEKLAKQAWLVYRAAAA